MVPAKTWDLNEVITTSILSADSKLYVIRQKYKAK